MSKKMDFSSIVKTTKTTKYAQIHNKPLQELSDMNAIGLLAHLLSLPEGWEIRKGQLNEKFGRGKVDTARKILIEHGYWITIKFRVGKKDSYFYSVRDLPYEENEVEELVKYLQENSIHPVYEVISKFGHKKLNEPKKADNTNDFCDADFRQPKMDSPKVTPINKTSNKKTEKENKKNTVNKFVNKEDENFDENSLQETKENEQEKIINELTNEYRLKGLSKSLCLRVVAEVLEKDDIGDFEKYLRACLEETLRKVKIKTGQMPDPVAEHFGWNERSNDNGSDEHGNDIPDIDDDDLPW